eukprot:353822-Chlamydomonas_euryale.AAC.3
MATGGKAVQELVAQTHGAHQSEVLAPLPRQPMAMVDAADAHASGRSGCGGGHGYRSWNASGRLHSHAHGKAWHGTGHAPSVPYRRRHQQGCGARHCSLCRLASPPS